MCWFVRIDGKDTEFEGPDPIDWKGETLYPRSRTFIPAKLSDNVFLSSDPNYRATLQALPEPLRSQLLYSDHSIGLEDDEWQVIPTSWVRAAQGHWHDGRGDTPLSAIGVDVAQGGRDSTTLARRYGEWIAEIEAHQGAQVLDAGVNAGHLRRALAEGGYAVIDTDGIGASTYHLLRPEFGGRVRAYAGSAQTTVKDRAGVLEFANVRAAPTGSSATVSTRPVTAWWRCLRTAASWPT